MSETPVPDPAEVVEYAALSTIDDIVTEAKRDIDQYFDKHEKRLNEALQEPNIDWRDQIKARGALVAIKSARLILSVPDDFDGDTD